MGQLKERDEKIQKLTYWLGELKQRQFGRRSESQTHENQQLLSFLIEGVAALKPEPKVAPPPPDPGKKGHGRARLPKSLLRDLVMHDLPKKDQRCDCCGKRLVVIGQTTSEQVEYRPASLHVKRDVR